MEFFGFVILVLGLIGAGMLKRHLREAKQLKLRQLIHEERMKAMEHNLDLPEVDDASLVHQILAASIRLPIARGEVLPSPSCGCGLFPCAWV